MRSVTQTQRRAGTRVTTRKDPESPDGVPGSRCVVVSGSSASSRLQHVDVLLRADALQLVRPDADRDLAQVGRAQEVHVGARLADAAADRERDLVVQVIWWYGCSRSYSGPAIFICATSVSFVTRMPIEVSS